MNRRTSNTEIALSFLMLLAICIVAFIVAHAAWLEHYA